MSFNKDEPKDIMLNEVSQKKDILYDSTYMRYLKQSNSYKHEVEWCLPGPRGRRKYLMGTEFILQDEKNF